MNRPYLHTRLCPLFIRIPVHVDLQSACLRILLFFAIWTIFSCSTTKNLPAGEILYTGIRSIDIVDRDSIQVSDEVLDQIDEVFSFPPNNSFLGSSYTRIPFPLGLWVYQANVHKTGTFNRWMMNWLADNPVLITTVRPDTRTRIVRNILRENGYFDSEVDYTVIPDKKDTLKAKINYAITLNEPYLIDSIEWRRMQNRGDTLLTLN